VRVVVLKLAVQLDDGIEETPAEIGRVIGEGLRKAFPLALCAKLGIAAMEIPSAREQRPVDYWVPVADVAGCNVMPWDSAVILSKAIAKVRSDGDRKAMLGWQALELMAADFLAGR
jgi:hypothetical protein